MSQHAIYADHSATTPVRPEVVAAMEPYFTLQYGNASSVYQIGQDARHAVEEARRKVAKALGAKSREIYFTSGGSESDNWALKGTAMADFLRTGRKGRIITTAIEHHAILHSLDTLKKFGFQVTYLPVDKDGYVTPDQVEKALTDDTILVSVMMANNEIGTIEPVGQIGTMLRQKGILFHVDAVQALGKIPIDVSAQHIDLLSLSSHKVYGPKGVGALYVREGVDLPSYIDGGGQERGMRAGTENVPGIVGFGKAVELATMDLDKEAERESALRDRLIDGILSQIPDAVLNGPRFDRLPGHVNFSFPDVEGESLLVLLDLKGIYASSGSACSAGSLEPSHVLTAIGRDKETARGSLRLTLGRENTQEDVDKIIEEVSAIVKKLRNMRAGF